MHALNKPINRTPLFALFTANAISMVGNVLTMIAIPWFVLQTTGSATQTGITGFFSLLPVVIAGLFGGALVDRLGYKRTSIAADLASGLTTALIPIHVLHDRPAILAVDGAGLLWRIARHAGQYGAIGVDPRTGRAGRHADRARHFAESNRRAQAHGCSARRWPDC